MTFCPHFNGPSPCDLIYIVQQLFVHVSIDGLLETCDAHVYGYLMIYWCCSGRVRERGREFTNDSVHTVVDICNENLSTFFDKLLEKSVWVADMFNNIAKWFETISGKKLHVAGPKEFFCSQGHCSTWHTLHVWLTTFRLRHMMRMCFLMTLWHTCTLDIVKFCSDLVRTS